MNARSTLPARADGHGARDGQSRRDWYRNEYLQSDHWRTTRQAALERAGHRCQVCNGDKRLDVHHRTYERLGEELAADLTVLCRGCHELYHGTKPAKPTRPRPATETPLPLYDRTHPALRGLPDRRTNWSNMTAPEQARLTECLLFLLDAEGPHNSKAIGDALGLRAGQIGSCLVCARRRGLVRKLNGRSWAITAKGAAM